MIPEIQIKKAKEKGVLPPSEEFIQEPARFNMSELMGNIEVGEILLRGVKKVGKYIYDTGIILGSALGGKEEEGK